MQSRLRKLPARLLPQGPWDVVRQVLLFAVVYYAYRITRGAVDDPAGAAVAFDNAREVIHLERSLGIFAEPDVQQWVSGSPLLLDASSWLYVNAQFTVTMGALVYLYLAHNPSFYFVRNMFTVAMGIAVLGYVLVPTAPPRFFPELGFADSVAAMTGVQHDSGLVGTLFNPYAAIPSMHVAFALMIAVPIARLARHRFVRVAWSLYPLLVVFVIVATANHFFIDAFAGLGTAAIAGSAAAWLGRARPGAWAFDPAKATA
jgi:hypothetical protein